MDWCLPLATRPGGASGWDRPDLPLSDGLPDRLSLDTSSVKHPPHPLFAVRLRMFIDWHRARGRDVTALPDPPLDALAALVPSGFADLFDHRSDDAVLSDPGLIVPATVLTEELQVDDAADSVQRLIEYEMEDVAVLGSAVFHAISELCSNALQHGRHELGVICAARRRVDPRRQIDVAIGDLGMGIPEHLRGQHPEWFDDSHAIAQAMEPGVSGTGDPHRGYGFTHTFEAALTSTLHAARIEVHSANGYVRREVVQEQAKVSGFPSPRPRRGTLIGWSVTSAVG